METGKAISPQNGRIKVIDALRGFSLIGICLIHSMQHFGVRGTMPAEVLFSWEGTADEIFRWLIDYLVAGKFYIIFSCLFGLSFFIQMDRASKKGVNFRPRFLWRLTLLMAIGYLHGLFFRIEILLIYALVGFVLVLMYKWPTKLLAGIALFLFLGGMSLVSLSYRSLVKPAVEQVEYRQAPRPSAIRPAPTLSETIKDNAWQGLSRKMDYQFSSGRIYLTLGLFILGFIIGRIRLFERLHEFRKRLHQWALVALVVLGLLYLAKGYIPPFAWRDTSILSWMGTTIGNLINLLTAYLWAIIVLEAYRSVRVQKVAEPLVSYGRMGLTNYIAQSLIGVFIFAGFGLDWSNLGISLSVFVGLTYTIVQVAFSHYWLKKFRYGPLEWVWRSGTYMKWQPLKRG